MQRGCECVAGVGLWSLKGQLARLKVKPLCVFLLMVTITNQTWYLIQQLIGHFFAAYKICSKADFRLVKLITLI